jgi:hypothetical protein
MIPNRAVFNVSLDNLVMPMKIDIHVFTSTPRALNCMKKGVDASLRRHDEVIAGQSSDNPS